jgi:hypothetical protein
LPSGIGAGQDRPARALPKREATPD